MRQYKVKVTPEARDDLKRYLSYIRNELKNPQAAKSVAMDFRETKKRLMSVADSIMEPINTKLSERKLKRINFVRHNYFILYRVSDESIEITNIFHGYEDFENKLK